jgi:hypothetical protein
VERASGSAGATLEPGVVAGYDRCDPVERSREWSCDVMDRGGSAGATYRVRVRPASSCWEGQLSHDYSEAGMPGRIAGCVNRWEWTLTDLLV